MIFLKAFLVGGAICLLAQLLMDLTSYRITPAHILVGFVSGGAVLSALGLYQPLVKFAGAGATVPLPGFGHLLAQGAIKGAAQKGLLGALGGGLEAAAAGVMAAVVFGYLVAVLFTPRGD
ncbi:MAG: stage sporulation protein [Eubacteriales bacterium]|nr:stage sporulation protein [Eubacteriales bacterium]MDN5363388.1 stage sporulation protein [Eubacteriales bacterium]